MGLFDNFPYTNFHELNLMWILEALKEIQTTTEQFVAINSLKYADPIQWNIVQQYEKNTIVIDPLTGTAYISVQPVPSGVALTNTDYWTVVFDLGSFVTKAAKNFTDRWEEATTLTATFPTTANDWLVWGDTLYVALVNITAGDQYVVDSNIKHFTIEDIIGHIADLTTTNKANLVVAINEINFILRALASSINEADNTEYSSSYPVNTIFWWNNALFITTSAVNAGDTIDNTNSASFNIQALLNYVDLGFNNIANIIGNLANLTTSDKSSVVNAIIEVDSKFKGLHILNLRDYGAAGDGVTNDFSAIQAWLKDVGDTGAIGYVPIGTYLVSGTSTPTYRNGTGANSVTIVGEDRYNSIFKRDDGAALAMIDLRNCHANLSNFTIDLNGVNDEDQVIHYGINYVEMLDLYVHKINIDNVGFVGVLGYTTDPATKFSYHVNFDDVVINGIGAISGSTYPWGIVAADTRNSNFHNVVVSNVNYYGLEIKNYSRDNNISDCSFTNCGHGINFGGDHNGGTPLTGYYVMNTNVNNIICRNVKYPLMANQVFIINATNFTVNSGVVDFAWLYKCRCVDIEFNGYADSSCDAILYSEGCNEIYIDIDGHCPSFAGYIIKNNTANGLNDDNIVVNLRGYYPDTNKVDNPATRTAIVNMPTRQRYNFSFTDNTL